jgi:hypothetical protein
VYAPSGNLKGLFREEMRIMEIVLPTGLLDAIASINKLGLGK